MIIKAKKVEELISESHNPQLFKALNEFISKITAEEGVIFKTSPDSMSVIGYLFKPYQTTTYDGVYPLISIAPQKNNISIYVMVVRDGQYLVPKYASEFGKSNCGKSCVRIKTMTDLKYSALEQLLAEAVASVSK
ncbi:DUF1801 domain-containing protein [Mollicutes bacterium LVI A0039]|nr:DUF1801 domain-containing protein [Mollicutes bacterium LVI A0039]